MLEHLLFSLSPFLSEALIVVAGLVAIRLLLALVRAWPILSGRVHRAFGVSSKDWAVYSTDLGLSRGKKYSHRGVAGIPDAVFRHRRERNRWLVAEYKSRLYRGNVSAREQYQVVLYMGLLRDCRWGSVQVEGMIRFRDASVPIAWNERLYEALKAMAPELRKARRTGRVPDPRPVEVRPRGE